MDDADFIEKSEDEIWQIINKMHSEGVRFEVVHSILKEMVKTLELQAYCEQWLSEFNKP